MNRNSVYPFGQAPGIKIPRSKMNRPFDHKTTFNAGKLVPIYCKQVLPGQTSEIDLNTFVRLATPVTPTMDNLILDLYAFFVPNRFLWDNFEKFLGANPDGSWTQQQTYVPPKLYAQSNVNTTFGVDDLGSYLGLYPANVRIPYASATLDQTDLTKFAPTALPIRAYCKIWNDWFRAEWIEKEIPYSHGNTHHILTSATPTGNFYTDIILGRGLAPVSKTADVFTRALPAPQNGESVRIPVADMFDGYFGISDTDDGEPSGTPVNARISAPGMTSSSSSVNAKITNEDSASFDNSPIISRLPIDSLGTINDLRNAFAIQRMLERDSRSGVRYTELLRSHFSVSNGDLRLGRSEYLGGKRIPINMSQVVQAGGSADTSSPTPLGSVAGLSVTGDHSSLFTKSFTEHGWLIICSVVRIAHHTYSQGIDRDKFFNTRYDLYWPELANIGEMAVFKKQLYAGSSTQSKIDESVFGYQEAWYFYRYSPNRLSGYMACQVSGSLNVWHYGDLYSDTQSLTSSWLHEGTTEIDRTLAVPSTTSHQFIADFFINEKVVLPMPLYSIPGLIDHV